MSTGLHPPLLFVCGEGPFRSTWAATTPWIVPPVGQVATGSSRWEAGSSVVLFGLHLNSRFCAGPVSTRHLSTHALTDTSKSSGSSKMFPLKLPIRLLGLALSFSLLLIVLLRSQSSPAPPDTANPFHAAVEAGTPNLHFLFPATHMTTLACRTLLSSLVMGYEPVVINWGSKETGGKARQIKVRRFPSSACSELRADNLIL